MSPIYEQFILRTSLTSPFGRKVRIAVDVLKLSARVTVVAADTTDDQDSLRQQNPIGKIPCLVREDGLGIYDSSIILEFLQEVASSQILIPIAGMERITCLVLTRLADSIIDAGAVIIYEERYHPEGQRSDYWINYQRGKIKRALDRFEEAPPSSHVTNAVSIGLACALAFLDKRKIMAWRDDHPKLVMWLEAFDLQEPAFSRTAAT